MNRLFREFRNKPFHFLVYFMFASPVVIVGLIALGKQRNPADEGSSATAQTGAGVVKREDLIQRVTIAGQVTPLRKTLMTAPYNGYVKKIFVHIGNRVEKGDPIVSVTQSLQNSDQVFPLRAPYPGKVVQVEKSEGEYVREGDPKEFIVRIDDLSKLFIMANSPEIDRVKLKVGQEAIIKASAILGRSYKGVIRELSLAAKEREQWGRAQVEFSIKVEILDPDEQLGPGMSAVIDIITNKKENVLTLRHEFIHREKESFFVILKDGSKRAIEVGISNEEAYEVVKGLKEGEEAQQIDFSTMVHGD